MGWAELSGPAAWAWVWGCNRLRRASPSRGIKTGAGNMLAESNLLESYSLRWTDTHTHTYTPACAQTLSAKPGHSFHNGCKSFTQALTFIHIFWPSLTHIHTHRYTQTTDSFIFFFQESSSFIHSALRFAFHPTSTTTGRGFKTWWIPGCTLPPPHISETLTDGGV